MKHLVNYQRQSDKGKLTAVANFEKLKFRSLTLRRSKLGDCGSCVCYTGEEYEAMLLVAS